MNGYTTIGITPEIQAHLDRKDWSEPVRVRARRGANGALELEFQGVGTGPAMTEPGCSHPRCVLDHPHPGPAILTKEKGAPRAADQ